MRQMFSGIADYEKPMIVATLKAARQRIRVREGKCEGRKAFGHSEQERDDPEDDETLRPRPGPARKSLRPKKCYPCDRYKVSPMSPGRTS